MATISERNVARHCLVLGGVACIALAVSSCNETAASTAHHVDDLAPMAFTEEVRIGSVDDPVIGFSRIRLVRVSEGGDVYVLDGMAKDVRVFNAEGLRLRVIGRPGQGPGEFSLPIGMGLLGDTLWVSDAQNRRLTWFAPDGSVLFTTPAHGVPFESGVRGVDLTLTPARPRPDGLIESDRSIFVAGDREIRAYRYPVVLFDRHGVVVDTVRWETADESVVTFRLGDRQGYAPTLGPVSPIDVPAHAGRVIVDWSVPEETANGVMRILTLDDKGDSVYSAELRYTAIPTPARVLDSLITPGLSTARMMGVTEREMENALREAIHLPDFRPPVRAVRAGVDGTVWLQLNTPRADSLAEWVVVGGDGFARGRLQLPARMQIHHSALPTVWVVDVDEFDVPWLIRLRAE